MPRTAKPPDKVIFSSWDSKTGELRHGVSPTRAQFARNLEDFYARLGIKATVTYDGDGNDVWPFPKKAKSQAKEGE